MGAGAMLHPSHFPSAPGRARYLAAIACAIVLCFPPSLARAQMQSGTPLPSAVGAAQKRWSEALPRPLATRAELDSLATRLENEAAATTDTSVQGWKRAQVKVIRDRLTEGDFHVGDRIYVSITGPQPYADTVSVRAGDSITVPGVVDVALHGVLRSELEPTVLKAVSALFRGATVRAKSLVWLSVLGPVGKPGFYAVPADIVVGDLLMRAGGPLPTAKLDNVVVRRAGVELYDRTDMNAVFAQGITLDQLELRSGDQVVVGEKKPKNISQVLQVSAYILSIGFGIYGFSRRR